jgi:hypothetical protein
MRILPHLLALAFTLTTATLALAADTMPNLHVGLRRSSYGLRAKNADHAWWAQQAKSFAARFPGATPVIIEIASTYQDDGTTQFGFRRPKDYTETASQMSFAGGRLDHEAALAEYDRQGVQAILQVESGDADMVECLQIIHRQFGQHRCVIGMGVDAEWFFSKESPKKEGRPITDTEARLWMETTTKLNPNYTLFLKHWATGHMPPTYRHPQLWFLSDSQHFKSAEEILGDFKDWADHFKQSTTGYQFGYKADQRWWSQLANPPVELGQRIQAQIPSCRYLMWVDFTADNVTF